MAGDGRGDQGSVARAPRPDAFGLKHSGLQAFLYADVGTDPNGLPFTMLSGLARLGHDPWAQAASWAAMPRAAAIDAVSQIIAEMPLVPGGLTADCDIAARLVQFLPADPRQGSAAAPGRLGVQPVAIVWWGIAAWLGLTLVLGIRPATNGVRPVGQSMAAAAPIAAVAAPSPHHAGGGAPAVAVVPPTGTGQGL